MFQIKDQRALKRALQAAVEAIVIKMNTPIGEKYREVDLDLDEAVAALVRVLEATR